MGRVRDSRVDSRAGRYPARCERARLRGQALVEFALVLPIVLVLLLTVSDFGRLFATTITIESAARAAAEVAATEYSR
jgi:Flp pilus assembly protein TadG